MALMRRASDRENKAGLLRILDDLAYLMECAALDYAGEGRYELGKLCARVETHPRYRCADSDLIAARLRQALEKYGGDPKNRTQCYSLLIILNRDLWRRIHPQDEVQHLMSA